MHKTETILALLCLLLLSLSIEDDYKGPIFVYIKAKFITLDLSSGAFLHMVLHWQLDISIMLADLGDSKA